jgi:hypothetical protein
MTKKELKQQISDAMAGKGIPENTDPAKMPDLIAEALATAIVEYVKNPEG